MREELIEAITEEPKVPWTFTKVAKEIGGSQFEDLTGHPPEAQEWRRAQDVLEEEPPVRRRLRGKREVEPPQASRGLGDGAGGQ